MARHRARRQSARRPNGYITPTDDASAVSRMRENRPYGSMWRGPETERWTTLHGHEAGNSGYSQGPSCTLPRRPPTRPRTHPKHHLQPRRRERKFDYGLSQNR
jgi:hypothetical protein